MQILKNFHLHKSFLVCCLSQGLEPNTFLSGSWDTTIKYWNVGSLSNSLQTISGHAAAVWSVIMLHNSNIVSASADKTIIIWSQNGLKIKTLNGKYTKLH